jgi:hypothetical protein
MAPPSGVDPWAMPSAVPISRCGDQLRSVLVDTAPCGPSPKPKRKRTTIRPRNPVPAAVSAVKSDHQPTATPITVRGPRRSASQPPMKQKGAYPMKNTLERG